MKLIDIVRQVSRDIDDQYDLGDVRDWVNRCLDDLTPVAKKQTSAMLTSPYTLPTNLHELRFLSQSNQYLNEISMDDLHSEGYKRWGDSIIVQNLDTSPLTIYYYRKLNKVFNGEDVPDLEEEFHDLLVYFCLGSMQFYDEDYEVRPDTFQRYQARKQEYVQFIEKRDRNRKKRVNEKVIW